MSGCQGACVHVCMCACVHACVCVDVWVSVLHIRRYYVLCVEKGASACACGQGGVCDYFQLDSGTHTITTLPSLEGSLLDRTCILE